MPWKKKTGTGASSTTMPLAVTEQRPTSLILERGTPASGSLTSWDVYVRKVGAPGPTHSPLLAVHYATSLAEVQ